MNPPDSCQKDQLDDPTKYPNAFLFDEKGDAVWYKIEGGIPHKREDVTGPSHEKTEEPKKIKDFDVSTWIEETQQLTDEARGSYRLVVIENPTGHPTKFPMMKDSLNLMLCKWGFPPLHELLHAIRNGGSAVFKAGSTGRRNFLIGGGVFTYSIGAIFSYNESSHITTGCIILGKEIKWPQRARDEFRRSSRDTNFNPLSIPVLLASILMDTLRTERDEFVKKIKKMEDDVEETVHQRNREPWSQRRQPKDHRLTFHELSKRERNLGRIQMLIERSNLIMKFAAETEKTWQGPQISANLHGRIKLIQNSLEFMSMEIKNLSGRLKSQVMIVTNYVAQQDIVLSSQIAEDSKAIAQDSKAIAAATRRDGAAMKIIAGVGAVFLPASVISAFLALLQLQWDTRKMAIVYFAITAPFTVLVLGVVYIFWRLLDEKLEIKTHKNR